MKRILNYLKALLFGIMPAVAGGLITMDVIYVVKNIAIIGSGSGWDVVLCFVLALIELVLAIMLLHELGELQLNANKWKAYKAEQIAQAINGSSDDETSNEAADT